MKVYVVVEMRKNNVPNLIGVYKDRQTAERNAYRPGLEWCNIIERTLE